jgi:hypothetical protein
MVRPVAVFACVAVCALAAGRADAAIGIVRTQTTIAPSPAYFGQRVTARLDVLVNSKAAVPASVETRARFAPYEIVGAPLLETKRDGSVVRVRYTYELACNSLACLTGAKRERKVDFQPVRVRYTDRKGNRHTVQVPWPEHRLVSRVGTNKFRPQTATEAERGLPTAPILELAADVSAPPSTYRVSPSVAALALLAAALVAVLCAGWLVGPVVALVRSSTGEAPELSPLDRALAGVDEAARQQPGSAEHREALALLARELRRSGMAELVRPARQLAWSEQSPTAAASRELVADVRRRGSR